MATDRPADGPPAHETFSVADLARAGGREFEIALEASERKSLAAELSLLDVPALRLKGRLSPADRDGWDLEARLLATVVQPCVVSLDPVTTRIDEKVIRRYRRELPDDDATGEIELPDDDTLERLEPRIDPRRVLTEALALALPLYPRAETAELGEAVFTEPGKAALTDDDAKPLAGLAKLRQQMEQDPE